MNPSSKFGIYQVLVRHFGLPAEPAIPNGDKAENGCGSFSALSQKALNGIRDLGMDMIWLTGILRHATQTRYEFEGFEAAHPATVKGKAGSPYAISDFFELDPDLASQPAKRWKEFDSLLARIRKSGMKTLIDFIPNHTARQYHSATARKLGLVDLGAKDRTDVFFHPENHYYYFPGQELQFPDPRVDGLGLVYREFPAKATGNDCFSPSPGVSDWYETVKLNYGRSYCHETSVFGPHLPTWQYMREVLRFWAGKGVDGFRCDMVELVPVEFWEWVIPSLKAEFPDLVFVAEVYNPHLYTSYLQQGKFDFLYDKVGLYDEVRALVEGKGDTQNITRVWQSQEGMEIRMLRFLENHDEQRIASVKVAANPFHALPGMALAVLMGPGPFMVYAGQELGESGDGRAGFSGDDGKTSIFDYYPVPALCRWQEAGFSDSELDESDRSLRKAYQELFRLRKEPAMAEGEFFDLQYANAFNRHYPASRLYAFFRHKGPDIFLVISSFLVGRHWIRLVVPPEAWRVLGIQSDKALKWKKVCGEGDDQLVFYQKASFDGDGGSPGILIRAEEYRFVVYQWIPE